MFKEHRIYILLFLAMFSVSTSPIIARLLENVPAVAISFWRMAIAAILLWTYSIFKRGIPLSNRNKNYTLLGGIFLGIHFHFFFESIKLTTIANATFLGTLAPLFTLIMEKFWLKRTLNKRVIYSLGAVFSGTFLILSDQFSFSSAYTQGNLFALFCSFWLGLTFMISENIRKDSGTVAYTRTLFATAAVTLLMISFYTQESLIGYSKIEYLGLLLLGVIPSILGHNTMYYAIRYVSPTIVASFPLGEPVLASIIAYFLFSEAVGVPIIIGGSITLIGLFSLTQSPKRGI